MECSMIFYSIVQQKTKCVVKITNNESFYYVALPGKAGQELVREGWCGIASGDKQ